MPSKKNLKFVLSVLLCILLVNSSTNLITYAKKVKVQERLTFEKDQINTSIVDPTKNILRILNATSLDTTITIKPSKRTLLNAKPATINGYFESDDVLSVDLTKLGPANLLPKGTYFVIAKRGTEKLQGQFNIVPASLILGKLRIPVPASKDTLNRIKRYQADGNSGLSASDFGFDAQATIIVHDSTSSDIKKPADGTIPIEVPLNLVVDEDENGNEKLYYTADTFTSIDADVKITGNPIIEAIFKVPLVQGEAPKETSLLSAVPLSKTDPKNNINNEGDINPEGDAIAKIVLATNALIKEETNSINTKPLDNTIIQLKNLTSGVTQNANSIPESVELLTTTYRTLGTAVAKSVNSGIFVNDKNLQSEISLNITGISPLVIKEDSQNANNPDTVNQLSAKPDPYVLGTVDKDFLPFQIDENLSADLLEKTGGLPLGSIKAITDGQNPVQLIKQEGQIAFELDGGKAIEEISTIRDAIESGKVQTIPTNLNTLPLLPGVIANNIKEITDAAKNALGSDSSFIIPVYPGAVLNGEKPDYGSFEFYPGSIILNPQITQLQNAKIVSNTFYDGPSINSLAASNDITVIPAALGKFVTNGAQVASSNGFDPAQNKVFILQAQNSTGAQPPSFLKTFDPSTQGTTFLNTFGMSNFIQNSAAIFTNAFGNNASPQLTNIAGIATNKPVFNPTGGVKTIGDVINSYQPGTTSGSNDLGAIFGGFGTTLFDGPKGTKPPPWGGNITNVNSCPPNCTVKTAVSCESTGLKEVGDCCCLENTDDTNGTNSCPDLCSPKLTRTCKEVGLEDFGTTCCCPSSTNTDTGLDCPDKCVYNSFNKLCSEISAFPFQGQGNCCCESAQENNANELGGNACQIGCFKNLSSTACVSQGYREGANNCCCSKGSNATGSSNSCPTGCFKNLLSTACVSQGYQEGANNCCCQGKSNRLPALHTK